MFIKDKPSVKEPIMHDDKIIQDVDSAIESVALPFMGIQNMGNTCYLNSVLQILLFCPDFSLKLTQTMALLESQTFSSAGNKSTKLDLMKELSHLLNCIAGKRCVASHDISSSEEVSKMSEKYVRPEKFVESFRKAYPMFEPYTQQDAQECLNCILDACGSAVESAVKKVEEIKELYEGSHNKMCGGRKSSCASVVTSTSTDNHKLSESNGKKVLSSKLATNNALPHKTIVIRSKALASETNMRDVRTSPAIGCFGRPKSKRNKPTSNESANGLVADKENCNIDKRDAPLSPPPSKRLRIGLTRNVNATNLRKSLLQNRLNGLRGYVSKKKYKLLADDVGTSQKKWATDRPFLSDPQGDEEVESTPEVIDLYHDTRTTEENFQTSTAKIDSNSSKPTKTLGLEERAKSANFVEQLFHGELVTTMRCSECENKVFRSETFQDISLPVKEPKPEERANDVCDLTTESCSTNNISDDSSLSWALSEFTSPEILDGENKYFCNVCRRLSDGEQTIRFKRLPPILTFHLKRFSTALDATFSFGTSVAKITSTLEIPSSLTFKEWCSDGCQEKDVMYTLFGIVTHSGVTISGGHYSSYVKYQSAIAEENDLKEYNNQWLEVDDEEVRLMSGEDIENVLKGKFSFSAKSPYLLFYHKN